MWDWLMVQDIISYRHSRETGNSIRTKEPAERAGYFPGTAPQLGGGDDNGRASADSLLATQSADIFIE